MEDLDKQITDKSNSFGSLLFKYVREKEEIFLEKISQQGDFWNFDIESVQDQPDLFWSFLNKKEASTFKANIKRCFNSECKTDIKWSLVNATIGVKYKGFVNHLFNDSNGTAYFNVTVFKEGLITPTVISENEEHSPSQYTSLKKSTDFLDQLLFTNNQEVSNKKFIKKIVQSLVQLEDIDIAEIWLVSYNESSLKLKGAAFKNQKFDNFQTIRSIQNGDGLPGKTYKKETVTYFENLQSHKQFFRNLEAGALEIETGIGIPIFAGDRLLGVLLAFSQKKLEEISSSWLFTLKIGEAIGWNLFYKNREYDFKSFFNYSPQIHAIIGIDGLIKKINPAFFDLTGFDIDLMKSSFYLDFVHPDDVIKAKTFFKSVFSGEEQAACVDLRIVDENSNYKTICWKAELDTSQDEVAFVFGEDKTKLLEQQALLKKATEMALMGDWVFNKQKGIITISKTLANILEYSGDLKLSEEKWFSFLADESALKKMQGLIAAAYTDHSSWDTFLKIKTAKGTVKWVRSMGWTSTLDNKKNIQGSIQDVHEFRAKQLRLENKSKYLYALAKINGTLIDTDSWSSTLNECIEIIGNSLHVDRAYYFDYCYDDLNDGYVFSHLYEWVNKGIRPQINDLELKNIAEEKIEPATSMLKSGRLFNENTSDITRSSFKSLLIDGQIKSIYLLPVFFKNEMQGLIGLDICSHERILTQEEINFFTTAVQNISIAFDKFYVNNELQTALEEKDYILESIQDGFFAMDEDYKVIYWNNKAEFIFKKSKIEILDEYIFEVLEDEELNELNSYFKLANVSEDALTFELYFNRLDCWLEFNVYGNSKGLSVYFRDITAQVLSYEKLKASNERFKLISDASNDAIWEWNLENDQLTWGDGFQRNFGIDLENEPPTLETWTKRIHKEDLPNVLKTIKNAVQATDEKKFYVRYRFLRDDGEYAYVIDRSSIIRNNKGQALKMVGAISDFTRIIKYENSLKELNKTLNERARDLDTINKELEQFAYVASHDLQEPLRMVSSFLKRLDEKYSAVLDEKGKKYIEFAVNGSERMRKIITDLLNYSRLINYEELKEEFDLNPLVDEIILENGKLITSRNAKINVDVLPQVISNKTPLKQIFGNLINNALKYAKDGEECKISISYKDNMTHWLFEVEDNGIGIEKKYFDKIFTIFQRLHDHSKYEGSGLGLAIVKKIVNKLGGEIWVDSELNEGTVFSFTIEKN